MSGGYDSDRMEAQLSQLHQQFPTSTQRPKDSLPQGIHLPPDQDFHGQVQERVLSWPFDLSEDGMYRDSEPARFSRQVDHNHLSSTESMDQLIDHPLLNAQPHRHFNPPANHPESLPRSPVTDVDLMQFSIQDLESAPLDSSQKRVRRSTEHQDSQRWDDPSSCSTAVYSQQLHQIPSSDPLDQASTIDDLSHNSITIPQNILTVATSLRLPYQESESSDTSPSPLPATAETIDRSQPPASQALAASRPPPISHLGPPVLHSALLKSTGSLSSHRRSPVSPAPAESLSHRPSLDSGCGFDIHSNTPSPSFLLCPISLPKFGIRNLEPKKKAPVSSTGRLKVFRQDSLCSSTNNSELERGFTSEDDGDRGPPITCHQTIQSMAGAPLPAVYELLQPSHPQSESARSTPIEVELETSKMSLPKHSPQLGSLESNSFKQSRLSDENLSRQTAIVSSSEQLKKRSKLLETERWARETACSSQSHSPDVDAMRSCHSRSSSNSKRPQSLPPNISTSLVEPERVGQDCLSNLVVNPAPISHPVPSIESGFVITSEAASVSDWVSETTHPGGPVPVPSYTTASLPTSANSDGRGVATSSQRSHSFDTTDPITKHPSVSPNVVIGDRESFHPPYRHGVGPLSSPLVLSSDALEDAMDSVASPSGLEHDDPSANQLLRARMSLQHAFATTPQARHPHPHPSPSPPTPTQNNVPRETRTPINLPRHVGDQSSDDSGLSPIKEDRTAELAAESHVRSKHGSSTVADLQTEYEFVGPTDNPFTHPHHHYSTSADQLAQLDEAESLLAQIEAMGIVNGGVTFRQSDHEDSFTSDVSSSSVVRFDTPLEAPASNVDHVEATRDVIQPVTQPSSYPSNLKNSPRSTPEPTHFHSNLTPPRLDQHVRSPPLPDQQIKSPPRLRSTSAPLSTQLSRSNTLPLRASGSRIPPPSIPTQARRAPPADSLNRNEMDEWKSKTGIDDRYALALKGYQAGIDSSGGSNVPIGAKRVIGMGGEERRGMRDRWGNTWGLESHLLSPLSERTERSVTTAASCLSLSTRQSAHSLRSIDSQKGHCPSNNSLAQRLNEAELNSRKLMSMSSARGPISALAKMMTRSNSCPTNNPVIPDHNKISEGQDLNLLEEKWKRKEARRLKREKREKRKLDDRLRSETLAQKQERRRQEKEKKERFLHQKQAILQQLLADPDNPALVRDLGILYLSCNAGIAGVKLAIRHLESSLQVCSTDPWAWSSLGKAWAQLHSLTEGNPPNSGTDEYEVEKQQQAHNATIGLRKAILNSRNAGEAMKFKIEWAHYLEKFGRWRESLGVLSEVISNEGKTNHSSWASLGFIGLRIGLGLSPLNDLETDELAQGFQENEDISSGLVKESINPPELAVEDRLKLLEQVGQAFERAIEIIEVQLTGPSPDNEAARATLCQYRYHYNHQLIRLNEVLVKLRASATSSSFNGGDKFNIRSAGANEPRLHSSPPLRHARSQPDLVACSDDHNRDQLSSSRLRPDEHQHRASSAALSGSETAKGSSTAFSPLDPNRSDVEHLEPPASDPAPRSAKSTTSPKSAIRLEGTEIPVVSDQSISDRGHVNRPTENREPEPEPTVDDAKRPDLQKPEESDVTEEKEVVDRIHHPAQYSSSPEPFSQENIDRSMLGEIPYHSDTEHRLQYDDVDTSNEYSEEDFARFQYAQPTCDENSRVQDLDTEEVRQDAGQMEAQDSLRLTEGQDQLRPIPSLELGRSRDGSPRCDADIQSLTSSKKPTSSHSISSQPCLRNRDINLRVTNPSPGRGQMVDSPRSCSSQRCSSPFERSSIPLRSPPVKPLSPLGQQGWQLPSPVASSPHQPPMSSHPPPSSAHINPSSSSPRLLRNLPPSPPFLGDRYFEESERCFVEASHPLPLDPHHLHRVDHSEPGHLSENHHHPDALPDEYRTRMMAFLELDQSYHSRTRQLRMRLVEVEEEHERKRREMLGHLGFNDIKRYNSAGSNARGEVQVPNRERRSGSTYSHLTGGPSLNQASPRRLGVLPLMTPGRSTLGPTVAVNPVTPRSTGAQVEVGGMSSHLRDNPPPNSDHRSRSTCSHFAGGPTSTQASPRRFGPPQPMTPAALGSAVPLHHTSTRSIRPHVEVGGLGHHHIHDHPSPAHPNVGVEVDFGRVGTSNAGQAEIALQGIAAILKLTNASSLSS